VARPVYSAQFLLYTDSAPNTEYEVPAGFTAVIRDITCYSEAAGTLAQLFIENAAGAPAVTVYSAEVLGFAAYDQWTGRVVVPSGGLMTLTFGELAVGLQVYVGGYLLTDATS